jgi:hypothetical protein
VCGSLSRLLEDNRIGIDMRAGLRINSFVSDYGL